MTIYERIKALREQQGISQQALAEKVGYKTASAVNKIELGLRDINQNKIMAFAKALNTTPAYLMGWEEPTDKNEQTENELDNELIERLLNLSDDEFKIVDGFVQGLIAKRENETDNK